MLTKAQNKDAHAVRVTVTVSAVSDHEPCIGACLPRAWDCQDFIAIELEVLVDEKSNRCSILRNGKACGVSQIVGLSIEADAERVSNMLDERRVPGG